MSISPEAYTFANYTIAGISFLACIFLFYLFYKANTKGVVSRIVVATGICDLIQALITILASSVEATTFSCSTLEFLLNWSVWASLLWSTSLAYLSYKSIANSRGFSPERYWTQCSIAITATSLFVSAIPLFSFSPVQYAFIGQDDFCSIIPDTSFSSGWGIFILSLYQGLPLIVSIGITFACYIGEINYVKNAIDESLRAKIGLEHPEKLMWYPITQLIVYAPHTLLIIFNLVSDASVNSFISFLFFCLFRFAGFLNTFVYLMINRPSASKHELNATVLSEYDDRTRRRFSKDEFFDI